MNPFKKGDWVYVAGIISRCCVGEVGRSSCFIDDMGDHYPYTQLSFTPWPQANHVRPFIPTLKVGDKLLAYGTVSKQSIAIVVSEETAHMIKTCNGDNYYKASFQFFRVSNEPIKF